MTKKFVALALLLGVTASLVTACGGGDTAPTESPADAPATESPAPSPAN